MLFDTKGHCFEREIIMLNVRWYLTYKLSYRDLEEMAAERGLEVDHTTIYRWVIKFTPELEKAVSLLKRHAAKSWRWDETYIKIRGQWKFRTAKITISGFETMRIIRKWQVKAKGNTSAEIFYSLAA